ncbi:MAG: PAS domain-containing protein, partial [Gemmatimonadales bacterium]
MSVVASHPHRVSLLHEAGLIVRPVAGPPGRPEAGDAAVLVLDAADVGVALPLLLLFQLPLDAPPSLESASACLPADASPDTIGAAVRRLAARAAHDRHLASVVSSTCAATYAASLPDGPVSWTGDLRGLVGLDAAHFAPDMMAWLSRIHPDDQRLMLEAVEQSLRTDAPYDMSYRVRCGDGAWRVWRDRGRLEVAADGAVRYVGGISDATAESAAHARFAALNDRLRVA